MTTMTTGTPAGPPAPTQSVTQEQPGTIRGAWLLVMNREIVVRALNKTFLVGLLVSIGLLAALVAYFAWQGSKTDEFTVALAPTDGTSIAVIENARELAIQEGERVEIDT